MSATSDLWQHFILPVGSSDFPCWWTIGRPRELTPRQSSQLPMQGRCEMEPKAASVVAYLGNLVLIIHLPAGAKLQSNRGRIDLAQIQRWRRDLDVQSLRAVASFVIVFVAYSNLTESRSTTTPQCTYCQQAGSCLCRRCFPGPACRYPPGDLIAAPSTC